jgi:phosphoglycolate phosphatase-like HAD superfamily hydrolase
MRKCWIFDVDGTLADSDHRKHHLEGGKKNWDGWFEDMDKDPLHQDVAMFLDFATLERVAVFICTGREEKYRDVTEKWLDDNYIQHWGLFMRKTGDRRDDSVIKKEMLDGIREAGFEPTIAFEDRDRVVKMWRENGVRCFQVAEGNF